MIPSADIVRLLLIAAGHGAATGTTWPVFVSFLPTDPDNAIVVYDTGGVLQGRLMETGDQVVKPGFQVMVRAKNHPLGYRRANEIATTLDRIKRARVVIPSGDAAGTYLVESISRTGDVLPMGVEGEGTERRHNFTVNGLLTAIKE